MRGGSILQQTRRRFVHKASREATWLVREPRPVFLPELRPCADDCAPDADDVCQRPITQGSNPGL